MKRRRLWAHRPKLPPLPGLATTREPLFTEARVPSEFADGTPITALQGIVSTRLLNGLRTLHCATVGELKALSDEELLALPNFGRKTFAVFRAVWPRCDDDADRAPPPGAASGGIGEKEAEATDLFEEPSCKKALTSPE